MVHPPTAALVASQGPFRGLLCPLRRGEPVTVGRGKDDTLRLADASCSRSHAEFRYEKGRWRVKDLASKNGTFVNGDRILGVAALEPGDEVTIGSTVLVLDFNAAVPPAPAKAKAKSKAKPPAPLSSAAAAPPLPSPATPSVASSAHASSAALAAPLPGPVSGPPETLPPLPLPPPLATAMDLGDQVDLAADADLESPTADASTWGPGIPPLPDAAPIEPSLTPMAQAPADDGLADLREALGAIAAPSDAAHQDPDGAMPASHAPPDLAPAIAASAPTPPAAPSVAIFQSPTPPATSSSPPAMPGDAGPRRVAPPFAPARPAPPTPATPLAPPSAIDPTKPALEAPSDTWRQMIELELRNLAEAGSTAPEPGHLAPPPAPASASRPREGGFRAESPLRLKDDDDEEPALDRLVPVVTANLENLAPLRPPPPAAAVPSDTGLSDSGAAFAQPRAEPRRVSDPVAPRAAKRREP